MNGEANTSEANAEQKAAGYCRICGKALHEAETRAAGGTIYCAEHVPASPPPPPPSQATPLPGSPYAAPSSAAGDSSPGLAFILGLIPGVGAIYNSQYVKGFVHVVIFGLLIAILDTGLGSLSALFGILLGVWVLYMAFEAFHTAKKKQRGEAVDEFSSLVPLRIQEGSKLGPILLIAGGGFFLLVTLDLIEFIHVVRFWPVLLIVLGVYMLFSRMREGSADSREEVGHE